MEDQKSLKGKGKKTEKAEDSKIAAETVRELGSDNKKTTQDEKEAIESAQKAMEQAAKDDKPKEKAPEVITITPPMPKPPTGSVELGAGQRFLPVYCPDKFVYNADYQGRHAKLGWASSIDVTLSPLGDYAIARCRPDMRHEPWAELTCDVENSSSYEKSFYYKRACHIKKMMDKYEVFGWVYNLQCHEKPYFKNSFNVLDEMGWNIEGFIGELDKHTALEAKTALIEVWRTWNVTRRGPIATADRFMTDWEDAFHTALQDILLPHQRDARVVWNWLRNANNGMYTLGEIANTQKGNDYSPQWTVLNWPDWSNSFHSMLFANDYFRKAYFDEYRLRLESMIKPAFNKDEAWLSRLAQSLQINYVRADPNRSVLNAIANANHERGFYDYITVVMLNRLFTIQMNVEGIPMSIANLAQLVTFLMAKAVMKRCTMSPSTINSIDNYIARVLILARDDRMNDDPIFMNTVTNNTGQRNALTYYYSTVQGIPEVVESWRAFLYTDDNIPGSGWAGAGVAQQYRQVLNLPPIPQTRGSTVYTQMNFNPNWYFEPLFGGPHNFLQQRNDDQWANFIKMAASIAADARNFRLQLQGINYASLGAVLSFLTAPTVRANQITKVNELVRQLALGQDSLVMSDAETGNGPIGTWTYPTITNNVSYVGVMSSLPGDTLDWGQPETTSTRLTVGDRFVVSSIEDIVWGLYTFDAQETANIKPDPQMLLGTKALLEEARAFTCAYAFWKAFLPQPYSSGDLIREALKAVGCEPLRRCITTAFLNRKELTNFKTSQTYTPPYDPNSIFLQVLDLTWRTFFANMNWFGVANQFYYNPALRRDGAGTLRTLVFKRAYVGATPPLQNTVATYDWNGLRDAYTGSTLTETMDLTLTDRSLVVRFTFELPLCWVHLKDWKALDVIGHDERGVFKVMNMLTNAGLWADDRLTWEFASANAFMQMCRWMTDQIDYEELADASQVVKYRHQIIFSVLMDLFDTKYFTFVPGMATDVANSSPI